MTRRLTLSTGAILAATLAVAPVQAADGKAGPDFEKQDTLYAVSTAHLDTQWRWTIQDTIEKHILNTLNVQFERFEESPGYTFSFEGSFRYMLMKEYYPDLYARLKTYIAQGRWRVAGSSVDAGDMNVPSPESVIRHALYGNAYFQKEFGKTSRDILLPDCFGFGYTLPTVAAHCGLKGFSTQKLTWGGWIPTPFDIGRWRGVDGSEIIAALNAGGYTSKIKGNLTEDKRALDQIEKLRKESGLGVAYMYFGVGDIGGGPTKETVDWLQKSLDTKASVKVLSAGSDQLFRDLTPEQKQKLPVYDGELLMTIHGVGCYTSQAAMKRWNRKNELLADCAERASVVADWLGGAAYPREALTESWTRFLWHQFHDDLTGTSIPQAYTFSWNDEILSLNRFSSILGDGIGAVARALDTRVKGTPVVVFNPLSIDREDVLSARIAINGKAPKAFRVFGPDGKEVLSQTLATDANSVELLFVARVPSLGFAVYDVRTADTPCALPSQLKIAEDTLENSRYRVRVDKNGDVASVVDKTTGKELLAAPIRLEMLNNPSPRWPAWEIEHDAVAAPPREYVAGTPRIRVVESGPVRVSLEILREAAGSTFIQELRLSEGASADRLEFHTVIDWRSKNTLLKVAFPLAASNPKAAYDLGIGAIERGNNMPNLYEVPAQQWADLTDASGKSGVALMSDCKYGWDKPADNILRLTLLHTPSTSGHYDDQAWLDIGRHEMVYALQSHAGDWRADNRVAWQAAQFNQPPLAFQTQAHPGSLGKTFTFGNVNTSQVAIRALKKAENSDEVVIRLQELAGKDAKGVEVSLAKRISSAREVNGAEEAMGPAEVRDGRLVADLTRYQPRAFALQLAAAETKLDPPACKSLPIPFDVDVVSLDSNRKDGAFGDDGYCLSGDLLPKEIVAEGIRFEIGPTADGQKNAMTCNGQTVALNSDGFDRLYLLAASAGDDTAAEFAVDGKPFPLSIQSYTGFVGQWDSRVIDGQDTAPDFPVAAFIKRDSVAWVGTHRHTANGDNDAYRFTYLYKYSIPLAKGAKKLTLPKSPSIRILAMTLASNPNENTRPAGFLYDTASAPILSPSEGLFAKTMEVSIQNPVPGAEIRYTLDSTEPTETSPKYTGPLAIAKTTTLKAKAFRDGKAVGRSIRGGYTRMDARKPDNPAKAEPGLRCAYYEETYNRLPDFAAAKPVETSIAATFTIDSRRRDVDFAFHFTGYIEVPREGIYTFSTSSDDGSRLWIGDTLVVDNDGLHGMGARSGRIILAPGKHAIAVGYFQKGVDFGLEVKWRGPGIPEQAIPASALFHSPETQ